MNELNNIQILKVLKADKFTSPIFRGVFPRDQIPINIQYPSCLIVNTHVSEQVGEHWLAVYYDKIGIANFFDSYGNHPDYFGLKKYLDYTSTGWNYNSKCIQSLNTSFCGYYCLLFILSRSRNISLHDFLKYFKSDNDKEIKKLISDY